MSNCTYEFLDIHGNIDAQYAEDKLRHGEETAVKLYLDRTLPYAAEVKFEKTKTDPLGSFVNMNMTDSIKPAYSGVKSTLEEVGGKFPPIVKRWSAVRMRAGEMFKNDQDPEAEVKYVKEESPEFKEYIQKAKEDFELNEDLIPSKEKEETFNNYIADVESMWKMQEKVGNFEHDYLEHVIKIWEVTKKKLGDAANPADVVIEASKEFRKSNLGYTPEAEPGSYITDKVLYALEGVGIKLISEIGALEKKYGPLKAFPEKDLFSKKVTLNGKPIYGIADLILVTEDGKKAIIIDYKTKSESSFANFDNINATKMSGAFSSLPSNAKSHVELQVSIYKKILEEELGIETVETKALLITGSFKADGNAGAKRWTLSRVKPEETLFVDITARDGLIEAVTETENSTLEPSEVDNVMSDIFDDKLDTLISNESKYVDRQLTYVKETGGNFIWYEPSTRQPKRAKTLDEMKGIIKKAYAEFNNKRANAAADLATMFNKNMEIMRGSLWSFPGNSEKARHIFNGIKPEYYNVYTAADFKELTGLSNDFLIIENKITGDVRLVAIAPSYDNTYSFHEEGQEPATTVFGNYLSDKAVTKRYGKNMVPPATTHNLQLIRLGMIAKEINKKIPKLGKIKDIVSVTLGDGSTAFKSTMVDAQLGLITDMVGIMSDNDVDIPPSLQEIADEPGLIDPSDLKQDAFLNFIKTLDQDRDPLMRIAAISDKRANRKRKELKDYIQKLRDNNEDLLGDVKLKKLLMDYQKQVFWVLKKQPNITGKEAIYENEIYQEINNAYLSYNDLIVLEKPTFKEDFLSVVNSATTIRDPHGMTLHRVITEAEQGARDTLRPILAEHDLKLKAIIEYKGISTAKQVMTSDVYKDVYDGMLEDNFVFDSSNPEAWMQFKDPENMSNGLVDVQRDYIRFYNKNIKKLARLMYPPSIRDTMFPPEDAVARGGAPTWKTGYIPIVPKTATKQFQETMLMRRGTEISFSSMLESVGKIFKSMTRSVEDGRVGSMEPWSLSEVFLPQADDNPGRGSKEVRKLLGLDEHNNVIGPQQGFEMNPALIFNLFAVEAVRKDFMGAAAFAAEALDAKLVGDSAFPGIEVEPARKMISEIAKLRIHNKVNEEGKVGQTLDAAKKIGSMVIFAGSIRQGIADLGMTSASLTSATIGNTIMKVLFKRDPKFERKDLAWAAKQMTSSFGTQVMVDFGMFNSSLGEFTMDDYVGTRKKSMWQTKHMFAHFRNILRTMTQNVILAQMHHDGITQEAFTHDKKTNLWVYDELKDKRFYVYDPEHPIKGQQDNPPAKGSDDWAKWVKWKAVRKEMRREGAIDADNRMKRPYTTKELITMKQYAIQLFGALDNSEAMIAETASTWRSMLTFKKWIKHRWQNFYMPTHSTLKRGYWKKEFDNDGDLKELKYVEGEFEGLWQSIGGILQDINRLGFKEGFDKASDMRIENLSKLIGDLFMVLLLYNIYLWVDATDVIPEGMHTELKAGLTNSLGDLFIPYTLWNATTQSSPLAMASIAARTAKMGATSIAAAVTGDMDKAIEAGDKMMSVGGPWRAAKAITSIVTTPPGESV